jgi:transcription initiation factor TFIID subunit TAF12
MRSKHKKSIVCLVESTEALLNVLEKHKIDPDKIASKPQFKVLVHLIKTIIDGETGIPNELNDRLNELSDNLDLDNESNRTVH